MNSKQSFGSWVIRLAVAGILVGLMAAACAPSVDSVEQSQQEAGNIAIVKNQPVPDLGGYSFQRAVMIEMLLANNQAVNTYTYLFTEQTGLVIEVCASKGYPIPYATQLTSPMKHFYSGATLPNAEPDSLYKPPQADATYVLCVNPDGTTSPTYFEPKVFALPYRIQADKVLVREDGSASSLTIKAPTP